MKKMIALMMVVLALLTACETRVVMEQPGAQANALTVQGSTEFEAAPDIAKVRFRVETQSLTAQDAQNKNRGIANAVHDALVRAGVRESELETTDYHVEKVQEWDPTGQKMVDKGYRASNAFVVSTKQLDQVGSLLDVGVQAGANNVESITFQLSDAKQKEVKTEALRRAAQNAREKAEALAEGTNVRLGKVKSVSENSYVVLPYARYDVMAMKSEGAMAPPTPISPESVKVSAQVSVSYEVG